ncbi:hypothetical protein [Actinoplanes sp. NPDC051411]|uniref:hypothetical protein n=1 Tax=Actinoplanes sp. NPDC051411 TaxID=3155522 RepID=UPI00342AFEF8
MARIWQSFDLVVTLAVSLTIGVLGMLGLAGGPLLSGATLATLAALAAGSLHSRLQTGRLLELTRRHLVEKPPADRLLHVPAPGTEIDLAHATEIDIVGVTLNRTVRNHAAALTQCLRRGGTVRIAVIDPHGEVLGEAARRSTSPGAAGVFANRVRPTLDLLDTMTGRLEVRLLDFVPAFGLLAVDRHRPGGRLGVDIYSHTFDGTEAALTLRAGRDHVWYQHFLAELDQIWAAGRPR